MAGSDTAASAAAEGGVRNPVAARSGAGDLRDARLGATGSEAPRRADWNKAAASFDAFTMLELDDTARYLEEVGLRDGDTLLDVCCGSGRVALMAAQRCRGALGIDSSEAMIDLARSHASEMGLRNVRFRLMDWDAVLPGQNLERCDVVFASRCNAMVEVEKLSQLARRTVVAQFFGDAPPIPRLQEVLFAGCGDSSAFPRSPRSDGRMCVSQATSSVPITYVDLVRIVHERGYLPNLRVLPERFVAAFSTLDEAVAFACALRPERACGNEERVRANLMPFLREMDEGFEFKMETRAALVWWDVRRGGGD